MALWDKIGTSGDVEDRRGQRSTVAFGGGIIGLLLIAGMVLLSGGSTGDVLEAVLQQVTQQPTTTQQQTDQPFEDPNNYQSFASKVLGSTTETWNNIFQQNGLEYTPPKLVLFRDLTQSACGVASSAVGPHYCPYDQTIYLDETFFDEIRTRLSADAGGEDVAQAYVIAHETAHHAQNLLGTMEKYANSISDPAISTGMELQADCYAGIWANSVSKQGIFETENEINEAIELAGSIGDDRIQEKTQGQLNPETWTHGSSEQRVQWFKTGYSQASLAGCNTF